VRLQNLCSKVRHTDVVEAPKFCYLLGAVKSLLYSKTIHTLKIYGHVVCTRKLRQLPLTHSLLCPASTVASKSLSIDMLFTRQLMYGCTHFPDLGTNKYSVHMLVALLRGH
jgi:hypothetical protein